MFAWRRQVSPISFFNFNTTPSSQPRSRVALTIPYTLACIILRFARIMLRFGVGVLSGRVPIRHTAFHNSSLGGSSHLFLHRYWHVWLTWLFTSFTSRVRSHMVHSQYQHGPRLFFDKESSFVVLVLLHANPPDGFCSVLPCRPHLPHGPRPVCWLFNLCVDPTSLVDFQQPFPKCRLSATRSLCRLRRQHSLRGRFAPIRLSVFLLQPKTATFLAWLLQWLPWPSF